MRFSKSAVLVSICLFAVLAPLHSAHAEKTRKINFAIYQPPTHEYSVWIKELAPLLAEMSNNRLEAKISDAGTIAKARENIDAIQRQMADVGIVYLGFNSATMPALEVVGAVPFLFRSDYEWLKSWPKITPIVEKALMDKGYDNIKVSDVPFYGGWYKFATKDKKLEVPSDLEGLKIKAVGRGLMDYTKAIGGQSVSIPTAEVYEAASRGLIDGAIGVHTHWLGWNQMEVFDHLLDLPIAPTTSHFVISKKTLQDLGPELGPILENYVRMIAARMSMNSKVSELRNEMLASSKMEINRPAPKDLEAWYKPADLIIQDWVKRSEPYGAQILKIVEDARKSENKNFLDY